MKHLFLLVAVAACVGCQDDTAGNPPPKPMTEAVLNQRIQQIQSNPSIPPNAKQQAINQMKAAYEMMKSHSGASAGPNPK